MEYKAHSLKKRLPVMSRKKQMWLCLKNDDTFRKVRARNAAAENNQGQTANYVNSVSLIDRIARIAFPTSFAFFNFLYWLSYGMYKKEFSWSTIEQ
ncbi:hypothetical protein KR074_005136 [Drosophila pseudoananassae]|nr:hypothetical protein KR074_005136 [Drosophila pseudoananassae]